MAVLSKSLPTILFTSVGRRVELLRAFRHAYNEMGIQSRIIAVDIDPLAPALQWADTPYLVPRLSSPEYVSTLIEICHRERVDLVFPLIDPDIPLLAANRKSIEETGARLAVVPIEAAAIAADKWQTVNFFQSLNISTPKSWLSSSTPAPAIDYPVFIKPRRGSAAVHTFKVNNDREMEFFLDYVPDPIIHVCLFMNLFSLFPLSFAIFAL